MDTSTDIQALSETFSRVIAENSELRESLNDVKAMLATEDRDWVLFGSYLSGEKLEGFDLDELKEVSEKLRHYTTGNALMRRGHSLHTGYVFSNGFFIEGTETPQGQGRPTKLRQTFIKQVNQENIFSAAAQSELQKARYTDGMVLLACDSSRDEVRRIPLSEITGVKVSEEYSEDVIAYQRTWGSDSKGRSKRAWYLTDRFPAGSKPKSYGEGENRVQVDQGIVVIDGRFNRSVGFVLGVPDAIAAAVYVTAYDQILQYGRIVDESLSRILFKIVNKTKQGVQSSGVKVANFGGHGGTASMAEGQDIQALSGTRQNFNFSNARPVAAMAATSLDLSNVDFLADSSAAGSSYGAGQLLSDGVRNAMKQKQNEWIDIYHRVLSALGLGRPRIFFESMEAVDPYRAAQALTLLSPILFDGEYRMKGLDILNILGNANDIPETLKLRSQPAQTAATQSSPDQGVSNGTNSAGQGANDQRTDTISSSEAIRREMQNDDFLERLSGLVERLEAAQSK